MKKIPHLSLAVLLILSMAFVPAPGIAKMKTESSLPGSMDFAFLRAHRQGRGITLAWGMLNINNLSGFDIEKTMQDPNDPYSVWEWVATLPANAERSNKYTDNTVLPGISSYRIIAWYNSGYSSQSDIVSVRIVGH